MRSRTTSTRGRGPAARTGRWFRSAAVRRRFGSRASRWEERVPDLQDLCRAAVAAAKPSEQVEAYAEEARHTEVKARKGEIEGLTFSESRGVGIRLIAEGAVGFAWAADPSEPEIAHTVARAR